MVSTYAVMPTEIRCLCKLFSRVIPGQPREDVFNLSHDS